MLVQPGELLYSFWCSLCVECMHSLEEGCALLWRNTALFLCSSSSLVGPPTKRLSFGSWFSVGMKSTSVTRGRPFRMASMVTNLPNNFLMNAFICGYNAYMQGSSRWRDLLKVVKRGKTQVYYLKTFICIFVGGRV